ncbi:hypothetical protein HWV62_20856 [Athelia sp. TMB]|nr:hypothetical protein HWV62_20856 [Athelia sp. TMB]
MLREKGEEKSAKKQAIKDESVLARQRGQARRVKRQDFLQAASSDESDSGGNGIFTPQEADLVSLSKKMYLASALKVCQLQNPFPGRLMSEAPAVSTGISDGLLPTSLETGYQAKYFRSIMNQPGAALVHTAPPLMDQDQHMSAAGHLHDVPSTSTQDQPGAIPIHALPSTSTRDQHMADAGPAHLLPGTPIWDQPGAAPAHMTPSVFTRDQLMHDAALLAITASTQYQPGAVPIQPPPSGLTQDQHMYDVGSVHAHALPSTLNQAQPGSTSSQDPPDAPFAHTPPTSGLPATKTLSPSQPNPETARASSHVPPQELVPITRREFDIALEQVRIETKKEVEAQISRRIRERKGRTQAQEGLWPSDVEGDDEAESEDDSLDDEHPVRRPRTKFDTPRSGGFKPGPSPRKMKGSVQRRSAERNGLQGDIRVHARQLMGRKEKDSPWTGIVAEDLDPGYNSENAQDECCTPEDFRIHISGNPKSSWNLSCGRVFVESFLTEYPDHDKARVRDAWATHFLTLQGSYKRFLQSKEEKDTKSAKRRRQGRKTTMYHRRLEQAIDLKESYGVDLVTTVQLLGLSGMSSDESDHESGKGEPTYIIARKAWRSAAVTERLHVLDALHLRQRYRNESRATAGAWPRFRIPQVSKTSGRSAVLGLPRPYYNEQFLEGMASSWRNRHISKEACDLKVPPAIIQRAKKYDLSNRQIVTGKGQSLID